MLYKEPYPLKKSGLYVERDPQVFSIITSDDTRTNYRLTSANPEGVVILKAANDDDEDCKKITIVK